MKQNSNTPIRTMVPGVIPIATWWIKESPKNMKPKTWAFPSALLRASFLALPMLLTGCVGTFHEVSAPASGPPPKLKPTVLVLGDIRLPDARLSELDRKLMVHAFKLGVEKWCVAHDAFEFCRESAPATLPADAIVLNGTITEVEKGSAAARFWVGMGAGQQRVRGEFALHAPDGSKLTTFDARKSYLGGQGMGGWDMLKLEDLLDKLGQLVGETTDKWARGTKIGQAK